MRAFLRAREQPESDDEHDRPEQEDLGRGKPVLRLRCYACAGSGRLELVEKGGRSGRIVRCIACGGTGNVAVK